MRQVRPRVPIRQGPGDSVAERIRIGKGLHLYRRAETWWADISKAGRRLRRSTGTTDEDEARSIARTFAAETHQAVRVGFTLDDAYLLWLSERERSDTDRSALRVLRTRIGNRPATDLDNQIVSEGLAGMSPGAYNRVVNVLRAALRLSEERGKIPKAPKLPRKKVAEDRVRFLSPEELSRLRKTLPAHLLPAVEFSLATGLRQANVLGLRWDQVDMHHRMLHIPAGSMKAGKPHSIPLGEAALAVLNAQKGEHDTYCFTYRKKRIRSPKTGFARALKDAWIEDFRWHDLRHTWASWMAMAGAPLHAIQKAGAWATPDMVSRYSHLTPSAIGAYQDAAMKAISVTVSRTNRPKRRVNAR